LELEQEACAIKYKDLGATSSALGSILNYVRQNTVPRLEAPPPDKPGIHWGHHVVLGIMLASAYPASHYSSPDQADVDKCDSGHHRARYLLDLSLIGGPFTFTPAVCTHFG